jgi:hypothetical protein
MRLLRILPTVLLLTLAASASGQNPRKPGEIITPPARSERPPDRLQVGAAAPDFTLPTADGKGQVTLSRFKGQKPVVLIFGSHT